jgi:hypothetical protein
VEVVEDEHKRLGQRGGAEERAGRLEKPEARAFRVSGGWGWKLAVELSQLRQDLHEVGRSAAELVTKQLGITIPHVRAKRLNPRPEGRRTAGLPAAADDHVGAPLACTTGELLDEPALADAGFPADQEKAAFAGERLVETIEELAELGVAADEHAQLSRRRPLEESPFQLDPAGRP